MMNDALLAVICNRMKVADDRYGDFASAHEALGVACEEMAELLDAIRRNDRHAVEVEALDVAAVLIRLAEQLGRRSEPLLTRSGMR